MPTKKSGRGGGGGSGGGNNKRGRGKQTAPDGVAPPTGMQVFLSQLAAFDMSGLECSIEQKTGLARIFSVKFPAAPVDLAWRRARLESDPAWDDRMARLFAFIKATYTPEEYAKALVDAERFGRPGADVYELFAATATPPDERAHALSRAAGQ